MEKYFNSYCELLNNIQSRLGDILKGMPNQSYTLKKEYTALCLIEANNEEKYIKTPITSIAISRTYCQKPTPTIEFWPKDHNEIYIRDIAVRDVVLIADQIEKEIAYKNVDFCPFCCSKVIKYLGDGIYECQECGNQFEENELEFNDDGKQVIDYDVNVEVKDVMVIRVKATSKKDAIRMVEDDISMNGLLETENKAIRPFDNTPITDDCNFTITDANPQFAD